MPRHLRTCHLCEAMCGVVIETDGPTVTRIEGDPDDPLSHGYICPKAWGLKELHEDPDRLQRPLRRDGDGWREVSWKEAFAEAGERLGAIREEDGPSSVGIYLGNPTVHSMGATLGSQVLERALDTHAKFTASTLDQLPKQVSNWLLWGNQFLFAVPDVDHCDLLIVLGANPLVSNGSLMSAPGVRGRLRAIQRRGGRVVVLDPRRTETAEAADEHHFIRPGTDALWLAAMARTLIDDHGGPSGPHAARTTGREALRALLEPFSAEAVEAATGLKAADTRRLAAALASTERAAIYARVGTCVQAFGTLSSWLVDVVNLLAGHVDRTGGLLFPEPPVDILRTARWLNIEGARGRWHSRVRHAPEAMGELPAAVLAEEIATPGAGRLRGLIVVAGNPVLSAPGGPALDEALGKLDFMVSVDIYLNETSRRAHLILPPRSSLEDGHYDMGLGQVATRNTSKWSPPVFPATPDSYSDWDIVTEIAARVAKRRGKVGIGAAVRGIRAVGLERTLDLGLRGGPYGFPAKERLSLAKLRASPHGVDLGALRPNLGERLRPRDRRIDLAPALVVEELGRLRGLLTEARSPVVLVGRRDLRSNNSWMHNVPSLMKGPERCVLLVHPDDAQAYGVVDGATVRVRSRVGEVLVPARVTDEVMPGVVSLPHGWGHDLAGVRLSVASKRPGVNVNALTDPGPLDPPSGTAVLNGVPVTISPA